MLLARLRRRALRHPPRGLPAPRRRAARDGAGHPQHGRPAAQDLRGGAQTRVSWWRWGTVPGTAGCSAAPTGWPVRSRTWCRSTSRSPAARLTRGHHRRAAGPVGEVSTGLLVATALFGLAASLAGAAAPARPGSRLSVALTMAACACGFALAADVLATGDAAAVHTEPAAPAARVLAAPRPPRRALRRRLRGRRAVRHGLSPRLPGHGLSSRTGSCVLPLFVTTLLLVPGRVGRRHLPVPLGADGGDVAAPGPGRPPRIAARCSRPASGTR